MSLQTVIYIRVLVYVNVLEKIFEKVQKNCPRQVQLYIGQRLLHPSVHSAEHWLV